MAVHQLDEVLLLPSELIEKWSGIAVDIGGSAAKLAYRNKEDYKDGKPLFQDTEGTGRVRLALCSRENIDDMLAFMTQHCDITSPSDDIATLPCTGGGSQEYRRKITQALNVKLQVESELDCIGLAAWYMVRNLPDDQVVREMPQQGMRDAKPEVDALTRALENANKFSENEVAGIGQGLLTETDGQLKLNMKLKNPDHIFPILLVVYGSASTYLQIDRNGAVKTVEGTFYGARAFQGMGSLAAGAESFDELISLAAKGNHKNVDVMTEDMKIITSDADNIYAAAQDGIMVYVHGKAVNQKRDLFKREDIAASLLNGMCIHLTQALHLTALFYKLPKVYLGGNFLTPAIVRRFLTKQMMIRFCWQQDKDPVEFNFLRAGGHLGALGAFLKSVGV